MLDTLAAAYAADGRFQEAGATAHRAADIAQRSGFTTAEREYRERAALYDAGKPYVEAKPGPASR
jgi:hypothetical protein